MRLLESALKMKMVNLKFITFLVLIAELGFTNRAAAQNTLNLTGLDNTAPSSAAYSLRRLSTSYTGNIIKVRRSSDNSLLDIGYNGGNHLDTTALKTFVGAGNGFVDTWYDQSGNARDQTQSTTGNQPRIVSAGVIDRQNGQPAVYFNGSTSMASAAFTALSSGYTTCIVGGIASNTTFSTFGCKTNSNIPNPFDFYGTAVLCGNGSTHDSRTLTVGIEVASGYSQWTFGADATQMVAYRFGVNNIATATAPAAYGDASLPLYLGTRQDGSTTLNGYIGEYLLFPAVLSSGNRGIAECSQMNYFGMVSITGNTTLSTSTTTQLASGISGGTWTSSATGVATVGTGTGLVTGVSAGTALISYTLSTGCRATTVVTVNTASVGMNFDGTGDYVGVPNNTSFETNTGTIEAWIKPGWNSIAPNPCFISMRQSGVSSTRYSFHISGNRTGIGIFDGSGYSSTSYSFSQNVWYHIALVYSTTDCAVYVNGVYVSTIGRGISSETGKEFRIGAPDNAAPSEFWTGGIDEVRVWNTVRTPTEIAADMNCNIPQQAGLIGYYRFDEGIASGTNTAQPSTMDYSGNGNCGTLNNFALTGSSSNFVTGSVGNCNTISINTPAAITGTASVCPASPTTLANAVSGGTWSSSATGVATVGTTGIVTGVAAGTAVITYNLNCQIATRVVTVNPLPAAITGNTTLSNTITTLLASATGGGSWTSSATGVATVGTGTGLVTGVSAGTSLISYILPTGCRATTVVTVNSASVGIKLDGTNDRIDGTNASLPQGSSARTIEAWVNMPSTGGHKTLFNWGTFTSNQRTGLHVFNSQLYYVNEGNDFNATSATFSANTWTHVAATMSGTSVNFYINGVLMQSGTLPSGSPNTTGTDWTIGNTVGTGTPRDVFNGTIDEVRVWNVVRTQTEIANNMNCDVSQQAGLVAYYRFNEGIASGTNTAQPSIMDYSGNGSCGTLGNFALTGSSSNFVTGAVGNCNTISINTPAAITGTASVCPASTTTLANAVSGGTWSSSATGVATVGTTGIVTGVAAGTSVITYNLNCQIATMVVTVNPLPATITGNTTLSTTITTLLASATGGGTWTSSATGVATVGTGTGLVTGVSAGTSLISYTLPTGCRTTTVVTVITASVGMNFDGTNDAVIIGNSAAVQLTTGTIEAWIKTSGAGSSFRGIVVKRNAFGLFLENNVLITYNWGTSTTLSTGVNLGDNKWHHVALSFSDGVTNGSKVYIDGALVLTTTINVNGQDYSLVIGQGSTGVLQNFNGNIDEVRIWNAVLSQSTIQNNMNCNIPQQASLIGYYRFDEGVASGTNTGQPSIIDYSGNGLCGVLSNLALTGSSSNFVTGAVGSCNTISINTPAAITGLSTLCATGTITLANSVSGGTWSSSATGVATVGTTGIVTGVASGTTVITYSLNCRIATKVLTVAPLPAITGNGTLSTTITTLLSNATGGGTWTSSATGIATVGTGTGLVTGVSAGTAIISYTTASVCLVTQAVTVKTPNAGISFDGGNDRIDGTNSLLPQGGTARTIEAWIKMNVLSGSQAIFNWGTGTTNQWTGLVLNNNNLYYVNYFNDINATSATLATNTWTHVAVTASGTNVNFYINGVLMQSGTLGGTTNTTGTGFTIGSDSYVSFPQEMFNGLMDEVRVWNVARTQSEIANNMNCDVSQQAGLVAYYRFDEGTPSGTNTGQPMVMDYSGNGNCGTILNMALTGSSSNFVTGAVGSCNTISINTPAAITGTTFVCQSATTTLANAVSGGTWSSSATGVATVGTTGIVTGVAAGTTVVTYNLNCQIATTVVTVSPSPASITGTNICNGSTTTYNNATGGGTWSSSATGVANIGSATGIATGVSAGTTVITYQLSSTGCYTTTVITVNPLPATITGNTTLSTTITTLLANATGGGTWSSSATGVATVGTTGLVTGVSAGTSLISYTLPTGCRTTTVVTVNTASVGMHFDGSNDGVVLSNEAHFQIGTGTIEAWIKTSDAGSSYRGIIAKPFAYAIFLTDNVLGVYDWGAGVYRTTGLNIADNKWHHVASSFNSGVTNGSYIYLDGVQVLNFTYTTSNQTEGLTIGRDGDYGQNFAGNIDEARIWNVQRTGAEIAANMNCNIPQQAGLIGYYRFDEGVAGGTNTSQIFAYDYSGNNRCGTFSNMALTGSSSNYVTGSVGNCNTISMTGPAAISGASSVCQSATTALTNSVSGGTWSSSATGVATVGTTGIVTGVAAGTTVITYNLNCQIATKVVTVIASPAAITGNNTLSTTITTLLADATGGGTWTSSATGVATVGTTGLVTGVSAGTAVISYTGPTGCAATTVATVKTASNGLNFDGTDDVVSLGNSAAVQLTSGTIEAWIKTSGASGLRAIVVKQNAYGLFLWDNVLMSYSWGGIGVIYTGVDLADNKWHHVAMSFSDGVTNGTKIYIDGELVTTSTIVILDQTIDLVIGQGSNVTYQNFLGDIDEVRIWNTVLSQSTIQNNRNCNIPQQANLIGYYRFDEGSAGGTNTGQPRVIDYSGSGICGSLNNFALTGSTSNFATGSVGSCNTISINTPAAITGTTSICLPGTTTLANAVAGGAWSSSATGVATVGTTGIVTGVAAGTAVITYNLNCQIATTVVTVNANPASITGSNICIGSTATYTSATGGGTWSSSATGVATIGSSTGIATGVSGGTSVITYQLTSTGCYTTTLVTVNLTLPSITGTTVVCPLLTTTLANVAGGGAWSSSATGVATVGTGTGIVTGVAAGTSIISYIQPTGCFATTIVTVNPTPAVITGTASACPGFTSALSSATPSGNWSSSALGVATVGTLSGVVSAVSAGTTTITYTRSNGCYTTATFTNNPLPAAISGTGNVCAGFTTTYTDATGGGSWSSSATGVATVGSGTGVVTGVAAGSATITYTLGTGCYATAAVTVNAVPAAIGGTAKACAGFSTTLTNATVGGTWTSGAIGIVTVGTGTGVVTAVSAGTATITYTRSNGCFATKEYTVNALPATIGGTPNACLGFTSTLTNATGGGTWTSSAPSIATVGTGTGTVTGIAAASATITYTLSTGCYATSGFTVNANPATIGGTKTACEGFGTTLTNATGGGTWASANTGIATVGSTSGAVLGVSAGTTTITYTRSNGCYATTTYTVNTTPAAIGGTLNSCIGFTSTLTNATGGGTWTSASTGVATAGAGTGVITGITAGTANITYALSTGCYASANYTVNANPATIGGTTNVCTSGTTTLTDATGGGAWSVSNANATMGTGSGVVTGVTAGTAVVSYTLSTGCYKTTNINIYETPATISGTGSLCAGGTTTLTNSVSGGVWSSSATTVASVGSTTGIVTGVAGGTANITYNTGGSCYTTFTTTIGAILPITGTPSACTGASSTLSCGSAGGTWSSSNTAVATIGSTGVMTGVSVGTSIVTYALPSGCARYVTVYISDPGSSISGPSSVCVGQTITLTDAAAPGGAWTSSNGGIASVGLFTGVVTGRLASTVKITYTLGSSCYITKSLTVNAFSPSYAAVTNVMVGNTITVGNAMSGGVWSSGATGVASVNSTTGVVTGVSAGTASISYTVSSGCTDYINVTVNAAPSPISGPSVVCIGQAVTLTSGTLGGVWTSSNGGIALVGSSTGIVTGRLAAAVNITYTVGGAYSVRTMTVTAFTPSYASVYTAMSGNTISMNNTTSGGTWSSTNTGVATVNSTSGLVTGVGAGTTIISYAVASGCSDGTTITVTAAPSAITGPSVVCFSQTATLSSATPGGVWSSSNGAIATVGSSTGIVTPLIAAPVNITYTVGSGYAVKSMTVANFSPVYGSVTTINSGNTTTIFDATSGGVWSSSAPAIATVNSASGVVTGILSGTTMISYTMPTGCADGIMVTVAPTPAIGAGPGQVCVGSTLTLTHATPGGVWTSSNGGIALVGSSTGIVSGRIAATCTITYTLPSTVYVTTTITVLPSAAISGQTKICNGQSLTLTNSISGGTWYSSNGGVASAGSTTGVISGVSMGTSIISYVLPTGCYALKTVTVVAAMTGITGTPEVCNGSSVTLSHAISGGAWTSSNTGVATAVLFGGSITGVSAGTSSITYTVGPACKASVTFTVDPVPAAIGGGNSVCVSTPITLTDATAGGVWSSLDPSIATVGSSDGLVTGVTSGFTTTISYTLSGTGCYAVNSMAVNPCRMAGEEEVTKASAFSLIPNPNSGTFTLKGRYAASASEEEVSIEVVNTLGQSVYRSTIKAEQGRINEQVTLPGTLANGMYLLNLHTPNEQAVFHFVISK